MSDDELRKTHERLHGINDWQTALCFAGMVIIVVAVFVLMVLVIKVNVPPSGVIGGAMQGL